jgi:DNA topoisomerase IB
VNDPLVAAVMQPLRRRRSGSGQLLAYRTNEGWADVHSADINSYLKDVAGPDFSAKDFRTWSGTVFTAVQLALVEPHPRSAAARRRAIVAAVKQAADHLGNTPAVCRSSYIDSRVLDLFEEGRTIAAHGWPGSAGHGEQLRDAAEQALLALLTDTPGAAAA